MSSEHVYSLNYLFIFLREMNFELLFPKSGNLGVLYLNMLELLH